MKANVAKEASYLLKIDNSIKAIKEDNISLALDYIKNAILENQNYPEAHNLLGIIAEINNDFELAGKHYRAANALDPSYGPANNNLDRITSSLNDKFMETPDFGDGLKVANTPYVVEYDNGHVGHFKKKERN